MDITGFLMGYAAGQAEGAPVIEPGWCPMGEPCSFMLMGIAAAAVVAGGWAIVGSILENRSDR